MNSTTPKRHAETLRNWNIPFQLKKRNTYRNRIDNLLYPLLSLLYIIFPVKVHLFLEDERVGWINLEPISNYV
jgi:hypothetical protein